MKLGRKLLLCFSFVLLLAIVVIALGFNPISSTRSKSFITEYISAITHKNTQLKGSVVWQLLPRPRLKLENLQIGDNNLDEAYFIAADKVSLNLELLPLIKGQFIFKEITIDNLKLHINTEVPNKAESQPDKIYTKNEKLHDKPHFAIQNLALHHGQIIIENKDWHVQFNNVQAVIEQFAMYSLSFPLQYKSKIHVIAKNGGNKTTVLNSSSNFKGRLYLTHPFFAEIAHHFNDCSLTGQLSLHNTTIERFTIKHINTMLKANKDRVSFTPLILSLYEGEAVGRLSYRSKKHLFSLTQTATNLNAANLTKDLLGKKLITGALDYSLHACFPGRFPLLQTLNSNMSSKGQVTIKDGELTFINLKQIMTDLKEKLGERPHKVLESVSLNLTKGNTIPSTGHTPFKLATIQYHLQGNEFKLSSDSLVLQTETLQLTGVGTYNLLTGDIKLKLSALLDGFDLAPFRGMQQVLSNPLLIVVSGTLLRPIITIDIPKIKPLLKTLLNKPQVKQVFKKAACKFLKV